MRKVVIGELHRLAFCLEDGDVCEDHLKIMADTTLHRHPLCIMLYGFEVMFRRDWGFFPKEKLDG